MNKLRIGIDVDGVIFDYMNTVRAYAEIYDYCDLKKSGVINKQEMKVKHRYDWNDEETKCFGDKYFVELSKTTPFNPLAIEIIKKLKKEGHEINIISNRGLLHEDAVSVVEERFYEAGLKFDNLFWKVSDKIKVCKENGIDILIDDSTKECEEASRNNIIALYFREKNSKKLPENSMLYDIDNWGQAYRHIKEISKKDLTS